MSAWYNNHPKHISEVSWDYKPENRHRRTLKIDRVSEVVFDSLEATETKVDKLKEMFSSAEASDIESIRPTLVASSIETCANGGAR